MKTQTIAATLQALAFAGIASLAFTGCLNKAENDDFQNDGQSGFLTSEVDQMGQVFTGTPDGAAKLSAPGIDTNDIVGEAIIVPLAYHEECQCFVRKAKYQHVGGFERIRLDSIWLLDSAGNKLDKFSMATLAKVIHKRRVRKSLDSNEVDVRFDTEMEVKTANGAKVGVWNGTMTGTFNGQEFKNGEISNVTRAFANGRFHFPISGTIEVTRPAFRFLVEFLGDGKAKVTITNRANGRIHILYIDKHYKESDKP